MTSGGFNGKGGLTPPCLHKMQCRCFAKMSIILLLFLLDSWIVSAGAAQITLRSSSIFVNGRLVRGDFDYFENLMKQDHNVSHVVFEDCFGGYVDEGVKIGELIRLKRLSTIAKGQVQSSCAYAFLAGISRKFDSSFGVHLILLHATSNENAEKDIAAQANVALIPYLKILSSERLTSEILSLVRQSTLPFQGVVFVRENWIVVNTEKVAYCDGLERGNFKNCIVLPHVDALHLGVVTESK
ncbi:hypothetical protein [Variovorax soli]|uniref:Uncharacterized protein n=1 Tax=Variovorax soli TaxID=376815 RepID=A0ABU1NFH5_9BURK|nr:hypothetical protein [Variovorax soli]MDR6537209.1 hypothetical protein [Variovorax soli]